MAGLNFGSDVAGSVDRLFNNEHIPLGFRFFNFPIS